MFFKKSFYILIFSLFLLCKQALPDVIVSPLTKRKINSDSLGSSYSFIAWGHWYGSQLNWRSVLPSSTVLSTLDTMNAQKPLFIMAMGDIYRHTDSITFSNFQSLVLNKLTVPLFNTVGNHEMESRAFYESNFGKTFYSFQLKNELYIILDSEIAACELEGEQLQFLQNKLDSVATMSQIKHVFIFSHKLMWITLEKSFTSVFKDIHSDYECYNDTTFKNQIYSQLLELSTKKVVYWLSGDYGFSVFYHKVKEHNLTFLSCAINDSEEDAYLKIDVSDQKGVNVQAQSFMGKKLQPLEAYTIDYWQERIPHMDSLGKARLMLTHKYFWSGIAISLLILLIGVTFIRFFH